VTTHLVPVTGRCKCVKWLSGGCPYTVQPGRHDTRVFPIWVVMKYKFATLIWVIVTNRATKLSFLINPNRENSCVVASRLDGTRTTTRQPLDKIVRVREDASIFESSSHQQGDCTHIHGDTHTRGSPVEFRCSPPPGSIHSR